MGKKAGKADIRDLKKKVSKLRRKVREAKGPEAGPAVSPLAPAAFPDLPPIGGLRLAACAAGVRYPGRTDVMVAHLAPGTTMAGVFTRSATRSAAVLDCQSKLARAPLKGGWALVVNSGNSNAFTGAAGAQAVETIAKAAATELGVPEGHVLTASTGVIGEPLPHERVTAALPGLAATLSPDAAPQAARAIMTTDTFAKGAVATAEIDGKTVQVMGFAKGSGMIAPDMATMLAFLFTDAAVSTSALQALLSAANRETFNAITVDSDTSTSDTVLLAATGAARNAPVTTARSTGGKAFAVALRAVMEDLARQIVRDGEGATKFVEVRVTGGKTRAGADKVARAIANSPLVKTAIAGADPNWGRIVMAVGKSGAPADRDRLAIRFGDILVAEAGQVAPSYREEDGAAYMKRDELEITVDLGLGKAEARIWTCDLTHRYIAINADYRS